MCYRMTVKRDGLGTEILEVIDKTPIDDPEYKGCFRGRVLVGRFVGDIVARKYRECVRV